MRRCARAHIEHPCPRCSGDEVLRWYRGANRAAVSELAALLHKIDEGRVGRGASFAACRLAGVLASRLEDAAKGEGT